ncbi:adenosylcobinamide amidohydrolase [Halorubrum distributum JCM 9100]|uniref:Adenosylcobinamide amidohydrolase n=2 Tax=Halorubrum distributum TaxID=29283 RepID=M0EJX5_9EURY|nr:adenosylcobinamide amidohydrolase [Halorubrum distributum]ELZ48066.1 adenosylcobinamide amidohydrolase [Halorubrum distributum JCM 9100]ELZ54341.1 adenosylcobinamide amidohydrolase [Halorubrum distributum JCM 10118]
MFEATVREGVLRLRRPGTRWLSTGWDGGRSRAATAYNVTVPEGFDRTDLAAYRDERLARAEFGAEGNVGGDRDAAPTLFTGVSMDHARGARLGPVVAYATVGLSNPAMLPVEPEAASTAGTAGPTESREATGRTEGRPDPGTVNLIVGTTRRLAPGAAANLVAVAAEAKAATLLAAAGVPGTTSDAVVVGDDPAGEPAEFSGSATAVGGAARACVRDAVRAGLRSRYPDGDVPGPAADAEHGVVTDERAEVFDP